MVTIFAHMECVPVHISNFKDAAIITFLRVNTPPTHVESAKLPQFHLFFSVVEVLVEGQAQTKTKRKV